MRRALERVPGVERAEVEPLTGRARVAYRAGPGGAPGAARLAAAARGTVVFPAIRRLLAHVGHLRRARGGV